MRLKFFLLLGVFCLLSLFGMSQSHGLDRLLAPEEVEKLNKNIRQDPNSLISRRFLIDHYAKEKKWSELVAVAHPVQKNLFPAEQLILTRAYLELEDGKSAHSVIGFYQSEHGATSETKLLEASALTHLAEKDPVEASRRQKAVDIIAILRESIRLDNQNKQAYLQWIDTLEIFWTSYAEDALQVYTLLEAATKDFVSYLNEKCALYVDAQLWDQALDSCKKSVRHETAHQESYIHLAKAQGIKESLQESKKTLKTLVERFPDSAIGHKALAYDYYTENNFISAADHYKKATELNPNDSESFLYLAQSEFRQKKYLEALEAFKKNCHLSRTLASEFKHSTGELRSQYPLHNKYKKAMSSCQK